jgi:hypothetical protein
VPILRNLAPHEEVWAKTMSVLADYKAKVPVIKQALENKGSGGK